MNAANIMGFAAGVKTSASGNNSNSANSKDNSKKTMDFMKLVNESMASVQGSRANISSGTNAVDKGSGAFRVENPQSQNRMPDSGSTDAALASKNSVQQSYTKENMSGGNDQISSDRSGQDPMKEAMAEMSEGMEEVITDTAGVSDEEFIEAMEVLGLNFIDLMNTDNISLVAEELLSDAAGQEDLSNLISDITQGVAGVISDALESFGIAQEDFTKLVTDIVDEKVPLPPELSLVNPGDISAEDIQGLGQLTGAQQALNGMSVGNGSENADSGLSFLAMDASRDRSFFDNGAASDAVKIINVVDDITDEEPQTAEETLMNTEAEEGFVQTVTAESADGSASQGTDQNNSEESKVQLEMELNRLREKAADDAARRPLDTEAAFQTQINQSLNQAERTIAQTPEPISYTTVDTSDVINQIVTAASTEITDDVQRVEMTLNPQNLGRMIMQVQQQEGVVTARLIAQNHEVREALEAQLMQLRENLAQKGIKVDAVEISAGTHEFERNLEEGQNTGQQFEGDGQNTDQNRPSGSRMRNLNINDLDGLSGLMSEEEELAARIMRDNGNSVDYSA